MNKYKCTKSVSGYTDNGPEMGLYDLFCMQNGASGANAQRV